MAENQYTNKVALADGTVLIDLTSDTVVASKLAYGYTAHDQTGAPITGTNTFDSDTSGDTALVGEVISGATFHARGSALTGTMVNNGAVTGTISTVAGTYTVPVGYHDGTGTVAIDSTEQAKIIAANIKEGITILGVLGTHSGADSVTSQSKTVAPTFSSQTILPDSGYDYLSQVTVSAIAVVETDNAAGGKTVTIGTASV